MQKKVYIFNIFFSQKSICNITTFINIALSLPALSGATCGTQPDQLNSLNFGNLALTAFKGLARNLANNTPSLFPLAR
jgi:hypothetical protein